MDQRATNIDVDVLARSPVVRAFMLRILHEVSDPLTGHTFAVILAKRAADAFDLYYDNEPAFAHSLLVVAAEVIELNAARAQLGSIERTRSRGGTEGGSLRSARGREPSKEET